MVARQEKESARREVTEIAPDVLRMELSIRLPGLGHERLVVGGLTREQRREQRLESASRGCGQRLGLPVVGPGINLFEQLLGVGLLGGQGRMPKSGPGSGAW